MHRNMLRCITLDLEYTTGVCHERAGMIHAERVQPRRLRRLEDLLDAVDECRAAVLRVELMIDGIRELLDAEVSGFNDLDFVDRRHTTLLRPAVLPDVSVRGLRV